VTAIRSYNTEHSTTIVRRQVKYLNAILPGTPKGEGLEAIIVRPKSACGVRR